MTEQVINPSFESSNNSLLVESAEKIKACIQDRERIDAIIEQEREKLLSQFDSLVGQTVNIGGVAHEYFDTALQRRRGYEDYADRYISVTVPLAECEIVETRKSGSLSAVRVVHPASPARQQPYIQVDSLYFQ